MSTLKVQNIAHTNGTVAATVDTSGRMLTLNKPIFSGYRAGQYSTTGSIIPTDVRINQGGHYNTSTHVWTCPTNGFYVVGVNGIDNQALNLQLRKNGVTWKTAVYVTQTSGWASYADHEVHELSAGDTLGYYLYSGRIYSDSDHYYQTYIYLLG